MLIIDYPRYVHHKNKRKKLMKIKDDIARRFAAAMFIDPCPSAKSRIPQTMRQTHG
jgi:hypothetical protein